MSNESLDIKNVHKLSKGIINTPCTITTTKKSLFYIRRNTKGKLIKEIIT